jgi:uncharacterized membrane protein YhhN
MYLPILIPAAVLLVCNLYLEHKKNLIGTIMTKTPISLLFILAALITPQSLIPGYSILILIGLVFCLGGDVLLAVGTKKTFLFGLISFLLGHVLYVVAFTRLAPLGAWINWGLLIIAIISVVVFLWLKPHLGNMTGPVIAYIVIISLMLLGAWTVLGRPELSPIGRGMVFSGALLFYLSDLFVARKRFVAPGTINRIIGLPMYYAGQFLLAYSIWIS